MRWRRDGFMVKTRFDASVAKSQHPIPNQQRPVSERVTDSQDLVSRRVLDFQQLVAKLKATDPWERSTAMAMKFEIEKFDDKNNLMIDQIVMSQVILAEVKLQLELA
uniref:Uncharacterized protein n=1 Tax=Ananas comosus var. bracteatus TaxID=296719 RepID=A0A6V7Q6N6_ANACO|nr:unnamed protein product [Ananas comosus var. bracteatus]